MDQASKPRNTGAVGQEGHRGGVSAFVGGAERCRTFRRRSSLERGGFSR